MAHPMSIEPRLVGEEYLRIVRVETKLTKQETYSPLITSVFDLCCFSLYCYH